ncbi:MAG TPA: glycosyltransferase family 87 protein, partial [Candidatus Dormibacteraeota bacterium]|nr:glycosyltransferase family 87 protein [Candidatus Dormibacteraeota bacterium]
RLLQANPGCLYCDGAQAAQQASILGYVPAAGFPKPFVNPPLVAWALQPLAGLPLRSGLVLLVGALLVALLGTVLVGNRLLPASWPAGQRVALLLAGVASLPAVTAVGLAQWAPLMVLTALGALFALRRGRPVLAGVLLAVLLVKPQAVWLVLPALALARSWRVLLGVAAGGGIWLATGLLLVGPAQMLQLPRLILERHVGEAARTAGIPGLVSDVTGSGGAAFAAAVLLGVAAAAAGIAWRDRLRGRPELTVGLGVAASLAFAPHVFPDDLMLLVVSAVVWAPRAPWGALASMLSLSAAYLLDGWLPAPLAHLTPFAVLGVLVGLGVAGLRRAGAAPAAPAQRPAETAWRVGSTA